MADLAREAPVSSTRVAVPVVGSLMFSVTVKVAVSLEPGVPPVTLIFTSATVAVRCPAVIFGRGPMVVTVPVTIALAAATRRDARFAISTSGARSVGRRRRCGKRHRRQGNRLPACAEVPSPVPLLAVSVPLRPTALALVKSWANASSPLALFAQNVGVGLGYAVLAELVLAPQIVAGLRAAPVWPANGFVLAAVWLLGPRVLPGVGIAAAGVMLHQVPLAVAAVGFAAPMLQAGVALQALTRLDFDERLERLRDPIGLALVAAPAGALCSASLGT